ncbi:MAG: hypothetical protein R2769_03360 [Saprospiraceae bacterium]
MGVHVGCVITYEDEMMILNDRYYVGRALDNRMGGFMIAEVARLLHENKVKLPFGLYVVNSVQEEIGFERSRNDYPVFETELCHCNRRYT